jgi:[ribosomal protein S5]-alanine N-acetyltransferase
MALKTWSLLGFEPPARRLSAMPALYTERLDLLPLDAELLEASLDGRRAEVERRLGARLPETWPIYSDTFRMRLAQLREDPGLVPWLLHAMVLREEGRIVGQIGFHTAPGPEYLEAYSPGAVEFGFTILEGFRRRGFAREAGRALMRWATESHGIQNFILSIRPDNAASQGLARQWGFVKIGSQMDEVDGEEDVLELRVVS